MTKKDNAYVRALKLAREEIAGGNEEYVCNALRRAVVCNETLPMGVRLAAVSIRSWVTNKLRCSSGPVDIWLRRRGIELGHKELRQYRLAWIDHLIEKWKD